MSDSNMKNPEKSPCSIKSMPVPELTACPKCGAEIEVWSDEEEAACMSCGHRVIRDKAALR